MILSKVCFFPDKTEWCSFHKIPDFSSSHCVKGCFIEHLFGNAPICVSTILECNCCRIYRYVAAPKVRLWWGCHFTDSFGNKKTGNFHMGGGGGGGLVWAMPSQASRTFYSLLCGAYMAGEGAPILAPICVCSHCVLLGKMSGCAWLAPKISPLYWSGGPFYSFPTIGWCWSTNNILSPLANIVDGWAPLNHLPLVDIGGPTTFNLLYLSLLMVVD